MIDKVNNKQVSDILKDVAKQSQPLNRSVTDRADASLQISSESLIDQVKQIPSENTSAVEEARRLIAAGKLDTPENIKAAAQAILKFGV
ncbi:MAG: hypothetical protein A2Y10_16240 [Planctomycetes bacterium GWF2_41_51]|nr:MAG: hypothetical protein A2Y10_16240 [Planctomycetes bacterium GWF2_41_51]